MKRDRAGYALTFALTLGGCGDGSQTGEISPAATTGNSSSGCKKITQELPSPRSISHWEKPVEKKPQPSHPKMKNPLLQMDCDPGQLSSDNYDAAEAKLQEAMASAAERGTALTDAQKILLVGKELDNQFDFPKGASACAAYADCIRDAMSSFFQSKGGLESSTWVFLSEHRPGVMGSPAGDHSRSFAFDPSTQGSPAVVLDPWINNAFGGLGPSLGQKPYEIIDPRTQGGPFSKEWNINANQQDPCNNFVTDPNGNFIGPNVDGSSGLPNWLASSLSSAGMSRSKR